MSHVEIIGIPMADCFERGLQITCESGSIVIVRGNLNGRDRHVTFPCSRPVSSDIRFGEVFLPEKEPHA
jgi:hypothetical protein